MLEDVDKIIGTYDRLHHRENHFNCLRCKYEIFDFLGQQDDAEACVPAMQHLINTYELNALRGSLEQMLHRKMKHRTFLANLTDRRASVNQVAKTSGLYAHLYEDMNGHVNQLSKRFPKWSLKELFPLTYPEAQAVVA